MQQKHVADKEQLAAALAEKQAAGAVQVLQRSGNEIAYPNCLVVEPYRDTAGGDDLFATVEHYSQVESPSGFPWHIAPVNNDPLPFKDAMDLAMAYATRQGVPVILVNHDSLSSDEERQQTDTAVLNLGGSRARS